MSRVALAAGFTSLRRFNEAIRDTFHRAPRELRARARAHRTPARARRSACPYRAPFDAAGLFAYLAARAVPGVEWVGEGRVRRALRIAGRPLVVEVSAPAASPRARGARVRRRARRTGSRSPSACARCSISAPIPARSADSSAPTRGCAPLLRARPGVRVPGAWDPFEIAVRIVLGQQVTVAGATQLAGRLAQRFGEPLPDALVRCRTGRRCYSPSPHALADAPLEEIGLTAPARERAARARRGGGATAASRSRPGADPDAAREALLALPGIGPWTAELVLLRALGEPDAFPAGDLGLRRALGCDARALERRAERWRPWRAYAAMLLWTTAARERAHALRARSAARPVRRRRLPLHREQLEVVDEHAASRHDAGPAAPAVAERRADTRRAGARPRRPRRAPPASSESSCRAARPCGSLPRLRVEHACRRAAFRDS